MKILIIQFWKWMAVLTYYSISKSALHEINLTYLKMIFPINNPQIQNW